jgi:hypothetical protein
MDISLLPCSSPPWTVAAFQLSNRVSCYDRRSIGQSLRIERPSGDYNQIFITVRQLQVCWCGALSLTRGRVCRLQLLLAFASAFIIGFESLGARDCILLSQIREFPFRRPLRLAGSRWRYSTPPPHGRNGPNTKHLFQQYLLLHSYPLPRERVYPTVA